MKSKYKFTFADLCAGIGGFRISMEELGGTCLYTCDIDKECETTYYANYGEKFSEYDIHDINIKRFPKVDILCAGFPCQPFSIAGKRTGFDDKRSKVFFQILNIASVAKPKVILLENVPNIARMGSGQVLSDILTSLEKLGYKTTYEILDSADYGVPQARKRIYIVAFLECQYNGVFKFTKIKGKRIGFSDFIEKGDYSIPISEKWEKYIDLYTGKVTAAEIEFAIPKTRIELERIDPGVDLNNCIFQMRSSGIRALSIEKPLPTFAVSISGGGAMIPVYSKERRHLSILEIKRLMGFPDSFKMPVSRTSAIKQLANAVCPPVTKVIAKDILEHLLLLSIAK